MRIQNNPFITDLFKNLRKKEDELKEKPKTSIEAMLEQRRKEIENTNIHYKKESIARRIARGDNIGSDDRAFLAEHDPDLLRKADMVARKRKDLEMRLKRAKTEKEARDIMTEARIEVQQVSKNDITYANLLSEAYSEAEARINTKKKGSDEGKLNIEI